MKKHILISAFILISTVFYGCGEKIQIKTMSDLEGKKIGCQAGTTGEDVLRTKFQNVNVSLFRTGSEAALSLKNKNVDAVILDELPAQQLVKENSDLKIVDLKFEAEEYAIAVKKGNIHLLESINDTIIRIHQDGTFLDFVRAYLPLDGNIVIPTFPESQATEIIKMGTNASFPPFEFTQGTKVVGFDAALGEMIAQNNGKKLQIIDMSFGSLIEALKSDTIDFIAAGMTVTEERKAEVDFSIPYFSSKQVIIVRK